MGQSLCIPCYEGKHDQCEGMIVCICFFSHSKNKDMPKPKMTICKICNKNLREYTPLECLIHVSQHSLIIEYEPKGENNEL